MIRCAIINALLIYACSILECSDSCPSGFLLYKWETMEARFFYQDPVSRFHFKLNGESSYRLPHSGPTIIICLIANTRWLLSPQEGQNQGRLSFDSLRLLFILKFFLHRFTMQVSGSALLVRSRNWSCKMALGPLTPEMCLVTQFQFHQEGSAPKCTYPAPNVRKLSILRKHC